MKLLTGEDIGLHAFLSLDESQPIGIMIFHKHGASIITLESFIEDSKIDLSSVMRQKYACAFEIMAKQLRG